MDQNCQTWCGRRVKILGVNLQIRIFYFISSCIQTPRPQKNKSPRVKSYIIDFGEFYITVLVQKN